MTDKDLDRMLRNYCEADTDTALVYYPDRRRAKPAPHVRVRYSVAAAACLALVSALSLTAYFVFGNKATTPPIAPSDETSAVSQSESGSSSETAPSNAEGISPSSPGKATEAAGSTSAPTESARSGGSSAYRDRSDNQNTTISDPIEKPSAAGETSAPTTQPVQVQTEKPSESHTETASPEPTEAQAPTVQPTDGTDLAPTAKWINYLSQQTVSGVIQKSLLTGSGKVYFRLYAFDGSQLGDENLFSQSSLATVEDNPYNTVRASYYLGRLEDDLEKIQKGDCLTFRFFNEDGDVVFTDIKIF